ncbi:tetratricopeptide repeat protein [Aliikangiella sp. IMCC44359]|uniref:tetratricopeptide repeat protein n=1 Tax=Aliikangiella sp. IMCC44359 TaxID=3459125 RepID=UPI00403A93D8
MKKNPIIKLIAASLVSLSFSTSLLALPDTKLTKVCKPIINKNQKIEKPPIRGMSEKVHKRLTRAMELLADNKYSEGIEALKKLYDTSSDNYIKSVVAMNIANAYAQQNDYKQALPYFDNALKFGEGQLDHERLQSLRVNVATLTYSVGNKQKALDLLNEWISKSIKDDPKIYYLLSAMKAESGKYKEALCPAYLAVKHSKKPKKSYYNLLLVSHYEQKDLLGSSKVLKEMVESFPTEATYWRQLSSLYLQLDKSKDSLAIMEMLYLNGGFETETDYKTLSSLFAYEEIAYRSAEILEEGLNKGIVKPEEKNLKAIANNYRVSKEIDKAIAAFGRTAEVAKDGEHYLTQAELYSEKENWRAAIKSLDKALNKGVKDIGRVHFTKGSAQASLGQCVSSLKTLELATKYKKWRSRADAWIAYVKDKQKHNKCS